MIKQTAKLDARNIPKLRHSQSSDILWAKNTDAFQLEALISVKCEEDRQVKAHLDQTRGERRVNVGHKFVR